MIILDKVVVKGLDNKDYTLSFHIPLHRTTLITLPSSIDKIEVTKYIAGLSKPVSGSVIHEYGDRAIKHSIYIPEHVPHEMHLTSIIHSIAPGVFREITNLLKNIDYKIELDELSIETPDVVKKLFLILYTLYSADYLSVLVEPYIGLDNKLLSILSSEYKRLNSRGLTIIILTNTREYVKTEIDLHDYFVVVEPSGEIFEGDREKFRKRIIPSGLEICEVWSRVDVVSKLSGISGFNGYLRINHRKYLLFIDSRYRWVFLRLLNEMYRNKLITYYKFVGKESYR